MVTSPLGDGYASHNWNYYLLGGNKQQLAVYNGRETSRTDCYSSGNRVYFYPTEYLTYGYGSSALLTTRANGNQEYKVTDHLGSTRVVVDSTGYILSQYDYEPFGNPLAKTGLDSRKSYIDKEVDKESGDGNFGLRQMDGETGRFNQTEPLWEKYRDQSLYNYCGNNPLRLSDPTGEGWGDLFAGIARSVEFHYSFGKQIGVEGKIGGIMGGFDIDRESTKNTINLMGEKSQETTQEISLRVGIAKIGIDNSAKQSTEKGLYSLIDKNVVQVTQTTKVEVGTLSIGKTKTLTTTSILGQITSQKEAKGDIQVSANLSNSGIAVGKFEFKLGIGLGISVHGNKILGAISKFSGEVANSFLNVIDLRQHITK
ncbi:MAG: hypothetical protein JST20_12830 [Bacteroidetes bacterium]|nr:hypothetical protein [Bacteroidota bacterium]